jgi:trk system potassium uptake protein
VHVVVVGCGRVGAGLAGALTEAGHSVAVVDRKPGAFNRLPKGFAGETLTGIGFDRDLLERAGITRAAALAAVTNGDNSNILIARVARETYGVDRVVARIYDPRRAVIFERLGIPTVATVSWATERVLRRVLSDQSGVDWVDPSAKVALVERVLPSGWVGKRVSELEHDGVLRMVALGRLGTSTIAMGTTVMQEGDLLYMAVGNDALDQVDARLAGPTGSGH